MWQRWQSKKPALALVVAAAAASVAILVFEILDLVSPKDFGMT